MNWPALILDIRSRGFTLQEIAEHIGTSRGRIHDLQSGRQKTVNWEDGEALLKLQKKARRRKAKQ